jgi:hypothetical protein
LFTTCFDARRAKVFEEFRSSGVQEFRSSGVQEFRLGVNPVIASV